jgi:RNA polymerase sigma factor (sigma-70 family)
LKSKTDHKPDVRLAEVGDNELVVRIVVGEKHLLSELYNRYSGKVYYKCLSITKNKEIAKDLSHDIFIKVFTNLEKFRGDADFSFWIYSITYNTTISYLKKSNKFKPIELTKTEEMIDKGEEEMIRKTLLETRLEQLEELLKQLKPADRMVMLMRYQDDRSIKQISEVLGSKESAVKMRLKRIRDRMAVFFSDTGDE